MCSIVLKREGGGVIFSGGAIIAVVYGIIMFVHVCCIIHNLHRMTGADAENPKGGVHKTNLDEKVRANEMLILAWQHHYIYLWHYFMYNYDGSL